MSSETRSPAFIEIYVYEIPSYELFQITYYLDKNGAWIDAARIMGYSEEDINEFKQLATQERKSPDIMISYWGDQGNHTVTELFVVLYHVKQYEAMDCLKKFVDKKYHRLILRNQPNVSYATNSDEENPSGIDDGNKLESDVGIPHVPYAEILKATDHFNEKRKLGTGGFGCVYSGMWKNTEYAIKRIKYRGSKKGSKDIEKKQSMTELRFLNTCRHDNVLPLYGYSIDGKERCLVYQYMAGGSLERRLHIRGERNKVLTFEERQVIAVGTARGLQYLHTFNVKPLIHGDIKPANILLDSFGNPKIGDFGLAREGSMESTKVSQPYGTTPYVAQELLKHYTLSTKVDTYSFGVVLFEMFTGLSACTRKRGHPMTYLVHYMWTFENHLETAKKLIDQKMEINEVIKGLFLDLFKIGLECTRRNPDKRPEMHAVLAYLESKINNAVIE